MCRVNLTEYEQSGPLILSDDEVVFLRERYSSQIEIRKSGQRYILRPRSYVGFIQLTDKTIYIKPKIQDENLLFIISYLFDQIEFTDEIDLDTNPAETILDLMVLVLIQWTQRLIKRGLYRRYINRIEKIPRVRGKILTAKNVIYYDKLYCSYDELSYSVDENILLKATLRFILGFNVLSFLKQDAKILIQLMSEIENIRLSENIFTCIRYSRLNVHYLKLISLCYLIYKNYSIYQTSQNISFNGFLINMSEIFEEFIRKYLQRSLPQEIIGKRHLSNWATGIDLSYIPEMKPDIVIDGKLVADVKYYKSPLGTNQKFHSSHLYQILSYMDAFNLPGLLIYPEYELSVDNHFIVQTNHLFIKTLYFGGTREDLKMELNRFKDYITKIIKFDNDKVMG